MAATQSAIQYIEALAEELDISESRYKQAYDRYHSLGSWLSRVESTIKEYSPNVYVQGSFGLGTVIKPYTEKEEYDVDIVCELKALSKSNLSQFHLKQLLKTEIEAYRKANSMIRPLEERRRCWALNYADGAQFHMDIVPAVPDGKGLRLLLESRNLDARWSDTAIAITDNEHPQYIYISSDWPHSNPKGYLKWFKSRMETVFQRKRAQLAQALRESVEEIPEYRVRTPLQSAIMILKRHRDIMFSEDRANSCPISIIITTLAAHAYQGEESTGSALYTILSNMENAIQYDGNKYWIRNPSDPSENFADKWEQFPERSVAFFKWLEQARKDFNAIFAQTNKQLFTDSIAPSIGLALATRASNRINPTSGGLLRTGSSATAISNSSPSFGSEPRVPTKPKGFA